MSNFPPEKYYEACITYHLVNEFEVVFQRKLYPFSISQIEENSKGFDYGYTYSDKSFFIQYKRPMPNDINSSIYRWQIDREQLSVINRQNYKLQTYYALPAFTDTMMWFEGLKHTYFVLAPKLEVYLNNKTTKTNIINSKVNILKLWSYFSQSYASLQDNIAYKMGMKTVTIGDVISYTKTLDDKTRECTWVYFLKG